jgi:DNA helicase-2/ATP-dependent DNA helicase PcrA
MWTSHLNPEQVNAVNHNYGPLLILAGAGSGKTTVLVSRCGRLIQEGIARPEEICVLTFTNKAARELKFRVSEKLKTEGKKIWAGTFHSLGLVLLRQFRKEAGLRDNFGILDPSDATSLVKELLKDGNFFGKTSFDADKLLNRMSHWRETGKTETDSDDEYEIAVGWLLPRYHKKLSILHVVDFDDLLLRPIELMKNFPEVKLQIQHRFSQVMVDEFQDTNRMQMAFVDAISENHKNLTVVGDDDQSIYGWRGACIENILKFPKRFSECTVIRLEQNYRSSPHILNLANAVINKNKDRHDKILRPTKASSEDPLPELFVYENEIEETENVILEIESLIQKGQSRREIAILFRSNSQSALFEAELRKRHIPYSLSGGTAFFDRKETRDAIGYLQSALRPNEISFRRVLNTPPRGIGEKTFELLEQHSTLHKMSFYEAAKHWREAGVEERSGKSIDELLGNLNGLIPTVMDATAPASSHFLKFLDNQKYRDYLEKISANSGSATRRWQYLEILGSILDRFMEKGGRTPKSLKEFLDCLELRDSLDDSDRDEKISLMTLHACKGLEFESVFLVGVEEDILPHKTLGLDISEERRLFYVGVTRAKKQLILTRVKERRRQGRSKPAVASRFLLELPKTLYQEHQGSRPMKAENRKAMLDALFKKLDSLNP